MLSERIKRWRHVFKLDPNRRLSDKALEWICQSGTDAIIVGGTDGVTYENTNQLLDRLRNYSVECIQEISTTEAVVLGFDGYLIPMVLNTDNPYWIKGAHFEVMKKVGQWIPWDLLAVEGYIILNPDSKVAKLTESHTEVDDPSMIAYGRMTEKLFHLPICYVEYSGMYGDVSKVEAAKVGLEKTRLFYGGGISNEEQARTMAQHADTVVVGNLVYRNIEQAVETVKWVKKERMGWQEQQLESLLHHLRKNREG
ncbi:heptaprenylglyceryl phosphate synthase [Mechercharimyces sp. CAU 1602]|uniref:heptaprenylglyceryl phosphate synthase n=1 Tax=Mechercharimyces sp. CAU 1602 TaxID=2973933 RepID=UPI002161D1D0|nr:heptaprenylglyceryl phosphate synthase [Mechercharimyces sp. CAU 1602]MCS1351996.1 heptaprenylglyceryl phosphate synthase [Mechercharimyces sp. CAU 1602]